MPKKSKTGKSRRDEYYFMAKNTGLRARSSFKLIEINKLFHFLENASILIDLCAAPGGWMQIAANTMKKSSFIIGVDLVPIKPIAGTIAIQADITTDKCKQLIRKHILKAKADVILNDGAPNVGANWNVDEFQQAHLCLKAFALATEFLAKNGTFVTKVFRSKDYEPLKWVFDQFFEKVQPVKPKSSRSESAEIFLVCLKYKAPNPIDPKFLDIQHVFEDVNEEEVSELTYNKVNKKKRKALGYEDEDTLYKEVKVSELLTSKTPMNILLTANKIVIDDDEVKNHVLTTEVIKQYLADLKLLGKFDFKALEKWCKKMVPFYKKLHNLVPETIEVVEEESAPVEKTEEENIQDEIDKCENEIKKSEKKKLKKARQEKMKQIKLIQMSMLHPGDVIEQDYDADMFSASKNQDLIERGVIATDVDVSSLDKVLINMDNLKRQQKLIVKPTKETFQKSSEKYYDTEENFKTFEDSDKDSDDEESEEEEEMIEIDSLGDEDESEYECDDDDEGNEQSEVEDDEEETGVDLDASEDEEQAEIDDEEDEEMLSQDELIDSENEEMEVDEDDDEEECEDIGDESSESEDDGKIKKKKSAITDLNFDISAPTKKEKELKKVNSWFDNSEFSKLMNDIDEDDEDDEESGDSSEDEIVEDISDEKNPVPIKQEKTKTESNCKIDLKNPDHQAIMKTVKYKLTPKERALAVEMIKSKKSRRDILEWGYNRYQFDDENLPGWFVEDEKKHMTPRLPFVNKDQINVQKAAVSTNINKRTIKKVEQAKARKKHHLMRKLSKLNKRAEKMDDDMMEVEKRKKLQDLSKKVQRLKNTKKPVVTEVTNRSGQRSRVGEFKKGAKVKIVDRRMKKDLRGKAKAGAKPGKRGRK